MVEDRSKLDAIQQCRKSYDPCENAKGTVQVNTLVDSKFSRLALTYNACCCVTQIKYYHETVPEIQKISTSSDMSNSLDGNYFNLYSSQDETQYYVWYCTNCLSSDPSVPCATGIKVCISTDDADVVVALATQQQIDLNCDFSATVSESTVTITNATIGLSTAPTGSGLCCFNFSTPTAGCNRLTAVVNFTYDGNGNVIDVCRS